MTAANSPVLPVLLSRVLGHLTEQVEESAGVGDGVPSLAVWSNLLRCVADAGPGSLNEPVLPEAARISSRLATAAVTGSVRRGWITAEGSGKNRRLELSDAGRAAAKTWPDQLAALDKEWKDTDLRAGLEDLVGRLELELPHFPASYGAADPSATGAPFVRPKKPPEGVVHGTDWKPVRRGEGDTVSSLPITALLSQALMAFTIDYENKFPWPLNSTLTTLTHVEAEPKPLDHVPSDHGIAGNGKSLLERHLIVEVTKEPAGKGKLVALTDRGVQVKQHHPGRLESVETEWRERYGDEAVDRLAGALTPLATGEAASRPDHLMGRLDRG